MILTGSSTTKSPLDPVLAPVVVSTDPPPPSVELESESSSSPQPAAINATATVAPRNIRRILVPLQMSIAHARGADSTHFDPFKLAFGRAIRRQVERSPGGPTMPGNEPIAGSRSERLRRGDVEAESHATTPDGKLYA